MSLIQINTPFNIDLEFEIAEFHKRLLAYIIDFLLLIFYLFCMKELFYSGLDLDRSEVVGLDILIISIPMFLYSLCTELWMKGQTVGKKVLGIRVISLEGGEPTFGQYLTRWITRVWEWPFLFGYVAYSTVSIPIYTLITAFLGVIVVIIVAVNSKSQRLGDMAANTAVVNTSTSFSLADTVFMHVTNTDYKVMFPEVMRLSDRDINTIKSVLNHALKKGNFDMCNRVAMKVQDVLKINTNMYANDFLEKLLEDYNYLATRE
jgi:uncharacterized RDD family membrane protein YckC